LRERKSNPPAAHRSSLINISKPEPKSVRRISTAAIECLIATLAWQRARAANCIEPLRAALRANLIEAPPPDADGCMKNSASEKLPPARSKAAVSALEYEMIGGLTQACAAHGRAARGSG